MTSSTSSSEQRINKTDPDDRVRYHARRLMALKTILFGGGALLLALLLVNGLVSYLRYQFPNPFSVQRIQTAADALPAALALPADDERAVVYVLGSSLIQFGFSPDVFDQALADAGVPAMSFNFGYGNADPSIHQRFAARLEKIYADQPDVIDLVVFEFAPFQATETRARLTGQLDHAARAVLGDWRDFLTHALEDHDEAIALFNTRYLREGVPAEAITNMLAMPIKNAGRLGAKIEEPGAQPLDELGWALYHQLLEEWPHARPPGGWFEQDRGGFPSSASDEALMLSAKVMARMQHPERMEASRQQRIACCDMEDLQIDADMLDRFIAAIKSAQRVSGRVDVLLMPRNEDVIRLSQKGVANLQAALDRIRAETGVEVVDFSQTPRYGVELFFDADHLTLFEGREKFSRQLADYYARRGVRD